MRFLTDEEITDITRARREAVEDAQVMHDWGKLTISDLAIIRANAQEVARLADSAIAEHVNFLRAGGDISWSEVGRVLGVSKQAAQQKYG